MVEKLCLSLFFSCTKLRHYLMLEECVVVGKADVIRYMLSAPVLKGRIGKWMLGLAEFDLRFESAKAVKGQAIADFIMEHRKESIAMVEPMPWALFFDGSVCKNGCGIGLVVISPRGARFEFAYPIDPRRTNNQAEYEAISKGLSILLEIGADSIEVFRDSQLVLKQMSGEYDCKDDTLRRYLEECNRLCQEFRSVTLRHIPREQNMEANNLAQSASGYRAISEAKVAEIDADDWRKELIDYLQNPARSAPRKIRYKALKFVLI